MTLEELDLWKKDIVERKEKLYKLYNGCPIPVEEMEKLANEVMKHTAALEVVAGPQPVVRAAAENLKKVTDRIADE